MKLSDLMKIADDAYPDNLVAQWHCLATTGKVLGPGLCDPPGDTLASFIEVELRETFDETATDAEQLGEAVRVMETAQRELGVVVTALKWGGKVPCGRVMGGTVPS